MAVTIQASNVSSYLINGKEIYQDQNNNWITREELTTQEHKAWQEYLRVVLAQ